MATVITVAFVAGGIVLNLLILSYFHKALTGFGGPEAAAASFDGGIDYLTAENGLLDSFDLASGDDDFVGFIVVEGSSLLDASGPLSALLPTRDGLLIYKVQEGDTLSGVAAKFGISLNTILWSNSEINSNFVKPGQEVTILPVSGILHQIQEGDTLEAIANFYAVDASQILKFNRGISGGNLPLGVNLIIPGVKPKRNSSGDAALAGLPDLTGYFIMPTTGWNWGRLHTINAVDIANTCGTPIYAAAEGLVIDEKSYGWNSGYGHYVDIEHPNRVVTRYSHTERNLVSVGDYVLQGDLIAEIGNTGNTHGPTGCHLHFEVRGARNPFAK